MQVSFARQAAYELLLDLARGCEQNLRLLLEWMIPQHEKGFGE